MYNSNSLDFTLNPKILKKAIDSYAVLVKNHAQLRAYGNGDLQKFIAGRLKESLDSFRNSTPPSLVGLLQDNLGGIEREINAILNQTPPHSAKDNIDIS